MFIPPEICRLTNLHELNISNNQLKFLPWQMRDMKIEKLLVNPNPFLPEPIQFASDPDTSRPPLRTRRSITRLFSMRKEALAGATKPILSPVVLSLGRIPPLTELCLRRLLAPSAATPAQTVLVEYYGLPLSDQWTIPPNVRRTLTDVIPGILRPRKRFSIDTITLEDQAFGSGSGSATGTCPNPAHKGRVFVKHASERYSWERTVAGVDVGGAVPMRWRGCLAACLDFLDETGEREATWGGGVPVIGPRPPARAAQSEGSDVDVDLDMDMDAELAVQAVDLGKVSLDMDDFDE